MEKQRMIAISHYAIANSIIRQITFDRRLIGNSLEMQEHLYHFDYTIKGTLLSNQDLFSTEAESVLTERQLIAINAISNNDEASWSALADHLAESMFQNR